MVITGMFGDASSKSALDKIDIKSEISNLLLNAINCCECNEAIAIDLVKKASRLLKASEIIAEKLTSDSTIRAGGLAPWQASRVRNYVAERISGPISADELAKLSRLSTSYFCTRFKTTFGTPPHTYIIARRIERAKQLMVTTDAPLSEIALDCGLADQAHLSKLFRRITGATPSAWRRFNVRWDCEFGLGDDGDSHSVKSSTVADLSFERGRLLVGQRN